MLQGWQCLLQLLELLRLMIGLDFLFRLVLERRQHYHLSCLHYYPSRHLLRGLIRWFHRRFVVRHYWQFDFFAMRLIRQ
jgi:hypothetical protein